MKSNKGVNDAGLSAEDRQLVNEIQKHIDKTNSTQLICNYEIGKLINDAYGEQKIYGSGQVERIAEQVGKAPSTLYGYLGLAQDYTEENIQTLADGKFSTPYKLLRAYKKFGSNEIMQIHDEVDSLNEFKAKLKARWLELKAQKNDDHPELTVDPQDGEGDGDDDKGPDDTATPENENSPRGENSPAPEAEASPALTTNSHEKSPQDQQKDDNPDSEDDLSAPVVPTTPDAEATPALDDAPELEPDEGAPQGDGSPEIPNHDDIKQLAGSAVKIANPEGENTGTPVDMLNANLDEDPTGTDDGMVAIAKSRLAELEALEKENKGLKDERNKLLQENEGLKQLIGALEAQLTQKEPEPA